MYKSLLGHPIPEIATMQKTFIPEPVITSSDEALVALLPCSPDTLIMTALDQEDIDHVYRYASLHHKLKAEDIDWCVVDSTELQDILLHYMLTHRKAELESAILEALSLDNNEEK
jgi:hypothetical protein